jgi:U32 family peptidase
MNKHMQKLELLAPVGSREALIAAVENGADAVYLGGKAFSARQYAANFSNEEMAEAIRFAHLRGVKVYVAVNTLLDNSEIEQLIDYLHFLYLAGVDAIIVQDIGVAKVVREVIPELELHASTQMTIHNIEGVRLLEEYGFTRVVLAREMDLTEIQQIAQTTKTEIEVFVHGALCVCYSGQCLMSSMIGGRSGNRGRCAQPCRLPYTLVDDKGHPIEVGKETGEYLLSPRDLNTIEMLPQLIEAGVRSFKIEGRMKRPEYVATVVRNYRQALDRVLEDKTGFRVEVHQQKELAQIFNRDFTSGYLEGRQGIDLMSHRRPNNRGLRLGRVVRYSYDDRSAVIKLDEELRIGDGIEIWVTVGGRVGTIVTRMDVGESQVREAMPGTEVTVPIPEPVKPGDRVFKTNDARLIETAQATFAGPTPVRRIPIKVEVFAKEGQSMLIRMSDRDGYTAEAETSFIAEKALKRPLTYDTVAAQMDRMGNTIFSIAELHVDIEGEIMVPQSEMNAARRDVVSRLEALRLRPWERTLDEVGSKRAGAILIRDLLAPRKQANIKTLLAIKVDDVAAVQSAVDHGADVIHFGGESFSGRDFPETDFREAYEICRNKERQIVFSLPRIIKPGQMDGVARQLQMMNRLEPDAIAVANWGSMYLVKEQSNIPIYGDYPLNIFNNVALAFCHEHNIRQVTLSPELTFTQLEAIVKASPIPVECLVHGHVELMVTEFCAVGSYAGGLTCTSACRRVCRRGHYGLKDRKDMIFPIETDQFCRMHLFNTKELVMLSHIPRFIDAGVSSIRIEAKRKSAKEIAQIVSLYREVLDVNRNHRLLSNENALREIEHEDITRGHYFRGVL